jgi:hypothetical protein
MKPQDRLQIALTADKPSQTQRVLRQLYNRGNVSTIQAVRELYILRLASRIAELKAWGFDIENLEPNGEVANYRFKLEFHNYLYNHINDNSN